MPSQIKTLKSRLGHMLCEIGFGCERARRGDGAIRHLWILGLEPSRQVPRIRATCRDDLDEVTDIEIRMIEVKQTFAPCCSRCWTAAWCIPTNEQGPPMLNTMIVNNMSIFQHWTYLDQQKGTSGSRCLCCLWENSLRRIDARHRQEDPYALEPTGTCRADSINIWQLKIKLKIIMSIGNWVLQCWEWERCTLPSIHHQWTRKWDIQHHLREHKR